MRVLPTAQLIIAVSTLALSCVVVVVVTRPEPTAEQPPALVPGHGLRHPHQRDRIGEEKLDPATGQKRFPARRWVVERISQAWLSKCQAWLMRYAKCRANILGLLKRAGVLVGYRRLHRLSLLR